MPQKIVYHGVSYKENISGLAITTSLGAQENIKKMECLKNGFSAYHIFNPLGNSVKNHMAEKQNIVSILWVNSAEANFACFIIFSAL